MEALRANKLRAMLTMLGVIIGSACIVLVVTVALAGKRYIISQIEAVGANLVYGEVIHPGGTQPTSMADEISEADLQAVKSGEISDVHVAAFGPNVAVSRYTFAYDAELNGTHRARTVLCSDTWINDSGTWKTAASHCSLVKGE